MIVSIDMGYGYTKAVNSINKKEIIFPSVVAPANESVLGDEDFGFSKNQIGHNIQIREKNSINKENYLVGELALLEGRAAQMTLSRERFSRDTTVPLIMTAAYLAGAEGNTRLAAGLPLAYFKNQKKVAKEVLSGLGYSIKIGSEKETMINFTEVYLYPQCVGALFSHMGIPEKGIIGVVDVGYHTTDYLLVQINQGSLTPLTSYMSTIEVGMHTAVKRFASMYQEQTGKPLSMVEAQRLWNKEIAGKRGLDISPLKEAAKQEAGKAVAESVYNAWSEQLDHIDEILLAGGGGIDFYNMLNKYLEGVELLDNPQFANCKGFLSLAEIEEFKNVNTSN